MTSKKELAKEALTTHGQKIIARSRIRTIASLFLLCCGAILLYSGLSIDHHLFTTIGSIFILYALFMRFHIRKTKMIIDELKREIKDLIEEKEE